MNEVLDAVGNPKSALRIEAEGQGAYELRVYRDCIRLATSFEDVEHLLRLFSVATTFQQVRVLLKSYVIAWATLSDAAAALTNEVMQLRIPEKSVSWTLILQAPATRQTLLAQILKRHASPLRFTEYMSLRNDVAHRGWLVDFDFDQLHGEWLYTIGMHTARNQSSSLEETLRIAANQFDVHRKIRELASRKATQQGEHLEATFLLLEEVGEALKPAFRERVG